MTYATQPGTIPHKAIAWLRAMEMAQPQEVVKPTTADLCEAIEVDPNGFVTCMRPAIAAGLVRIHKRPHSKGFRWSLGDGTPPTVHRVEPGAAEELHAEPLKPRPGELFPGVAPSTFRCTIFEGQLLATGMEIIDGVAVFTPEQVRELKQVTDWARAA